MDLLEYVMKGEPARRKAFMQIDPGLSKEEYFGQRQSELVKAMCRREIEYTAAVVGGGSRYLCPRMVLAGATMHRLCGAESLEELWDIWVAWVEADIEAAKV